MKSDKYGNNFGMDTQLSSEYKDSTKYHLSKHDFELYDESKAVPTKVVRVKRLAGAAKGERWRIFIDNELQFVVEGNKLSKKECAFLRTVEGTVWLITEAKTGFNSLNELRARLKKKL